MRRNIEVQCYANAIFFADKIVNLIKSREHSTTSTSIQQSTAQVGVSPNQAAAPAGSRLLNEDQSNQSSMHQVLNNKSSEKTSDAAAHAFYDLAYCYLLNGEFLRCVELLENNELVYSSLKFRIITGQALLKAGNT